MGCIHKQSWIHKIDSSIEFEDYCSFWANISSTFGRILFAIYSPNLSALAQFMCMVSVKILRFRSVVLLLLNG